MSRTFFSAKPQIIAISLETAMQNGGVAFVILSLTFPSPFAEMGLLPGKHFNFEYSRHLIVSMQ